MANIDLNKYKLPTNTATGMDKYKIPVQVDTAIKTGTPIQDKGGIASSVGGFVKGLGIGAAKSVAGTLQSFAKPITGAMEAISGDKLGFTPEELSYKGVGQNVGGYGTDIAQLFAVPEVAIDKIGLGGLVKLAQSGKIPAKVTSKLIQAVKSKLGIKSAQVLSDAIVTTAPEAAKQIGEGNVDTNKLIGTAVLGAGAGQVVRGLTGKLGTLGQKVEAKIGDKTVQLDKITVNALTPKLTPTQLAEKAQQGLGSTKGKGLLSKPTGYDPLKDKNFIEVAKNAEGIVKGKSAVEDINSVRNAIGTEADKLMSNVKIANRSYVSREFKSALSKVETPDLIKSGENNIIFNRIKSKAVEIEQKNKGKVEGLFKARKEFDNYIQKEYPNIYTSDTMTGVKEGVKRVRDAWQSFIVKQLPKDVKYTESMKKQSLWYDAMDNLSTKVSSEEGKTLAERKFPGTTKAIKDVAKYAIPVGAVGTAAYEGKQFLGQ